MRERCGAWRNDGMNTSSVESEIARFRQAAEKMAGRNLDDFFSKYVRGREEIDYSAIVSGI